MNLNHYTEIDLKELTIKFHKIVLSGDIQKSFELLEKNGLKKDDRLKFFKLYKDAQDEAMSNIFSKSVKDPIGTNTIYRTSYILGCDLFLSGSKKNKKSIVISTLIIVIISIIGILKL